jgi:hypothetical protein
MREAIPTNQMAPGEDCEHGNQKSCQNCCRSTGVGSGAVQFMAEDKAESGISA